VEGAGPAFARLQPFLFGRAFLLFLIAALMHYLLVAFESSRRAETQSLEYRVLSREAELKALRAQLHPHFLFNSLNSVVALIKSDPEAARRTCVMLGDFLRSSLTLGARDSITLGDEVALAAGLMAIEKVRFGSRLTFDTRVDEAARPCRVPPLLLQPLIENAVTHGIAHLLEGGTIRLEAERRASLVVVTVENPRDPEAKASPGAGVGLDNVRRRLAAVYGDGARMTAVAEADRFRVELSFPAELPRS
jgi:LytS/YehU family sensor histidine kinase